MSSFVSDLTFQHDVFVSYARVDNLTFGQDKGWVERLVSHLREFLPQKLKRGQPDIWFDDASLPRHKSLQENIHQAVRQSATLLIILSENYLSSSWCQAELSNFLDAAAQTGGANGRIFLVLLDNLKPSDRPAPLDDLLGYQFFVQDEHSRRPRVLEPSTTDNPKRRELFFRAP